MMGVQYMICHWVINRTDPQNLLSTTLDILLQKGYGNEHDQWMTKTNLEYAKEAIQDYWTQLSRRNL